MWNASENRTMRAQALDVGFVQMKGERKCVWRNAAAPSFLTTFPTYGKKVSKSVDILDDTSMEDEKGPSSIPERGAIPAP